MNSQELLCDEKLRYMVYEIAKWICVLTQKRSEAYNFGFVLKVN